MELQLKFDEADWSRIRQDWNAWWQGELERPLVVLECIEQADLVTPHHASAFLTNHPFEQPVDEILDLFVPRLERTHYLGDAFPRYWPNFGPGIVAALAGAQVHPAWDTTWFTPGEPCQVTELHVRGDFQNAWWQRVLEFTRAAVRRWGSQLAIGLTDLGGNLDILASLRDTRQLLKDLVKTPKEVDRLVGETTELWLKCHQSLVDILRPCGKGITCWGPLWAVESGYMLQSDFAYMIPPVLFSRFVVPDLEACCARMEYPFYHLDGTGQLVHLDTLLRLPRLRGIQWVPGYGKPGCEAWIDVLGRIRKAGKLCQVTVTPGGAIKIMQELGGRGFCFVISEPQLTPEEGRELEMEIMKLDNFGR